MLYFSTFDSIELLSDEELGRFIKTEMKWLSGQSEEPQYEEIGSKFLHCRIKEQIILRDRNAKYKQDSRQKEDKQPEPQVSTYTESKKEIPQGTADKETGEIIIQIDDDNTDPYGEAIKELNGAKGWQLDYAMNNISKTKGLDFFKLKEMYENR